MEAHHILLKTKTPATQGIINVYYSRKRIHLLGHKGAKIPQAIPIRRANLPKFEPKMRRKKCNFDLNQDTF